MDFARTGGDGARFARSGVAVWGWRSGSEALVVVVVVVVDDDDNDDDVVVVVMLMIAHISRTFRGRSST